MKRLPFSGFIIAHIIQIVNSLYKKYRLFIIFVQGCAYCGGFVWSGVVGVVSLRCCRFDGEFSSNE
jgi:hypothetical protein